MRQGGAAQDGARERQLASPYTIASVPLDVCCTGQKLTIMPVCCVHGSVATCGCECGCGCLCRVLPTRRVQGASVARRVLGTRRIISAGYHVWFCSQPCPAFCSQSRCARCGQIWLLFRRRSESAPRKVFPAGYPLQCAPLLMTTPQCADRQRASITVASPASPDADPKRRSLRVWVGVVLHCVPMWAATCKMLTPADLPGSARPCQTTSDVMKRSRLASPGSRHAAECRARHVQEVKKSRRLPRPHV